MSDRLRMDDYARQAASTTKVNVVELISFHLFLIWRNTGQHLNFLAMNLPEWLIVEDDD